MGGTKSNVGLIKDFPGDQARRVWPRGRGSLKGGALLNMCLPPSLVLYDGLRGLGGEIVNQPVGLKGPSDSAVKYPRATTLFLV